MKKILSLAFLLLVLTSTVYATSIKSTEANFTTRANINNTLFVENGGLCVDTKYDWGNGLCLDYPMLNLKRTGTSGTQIVAGDYQNANIGGYLAIILGESTATSSMALRANTVIMGDLDSEGSGNTLSYTNANGLTLQSNDVGRYFTADPTSRYFGMGDIDGNYNGNRLIIDDENSQIELSASDVLTLNSNSQLNLNGAIYMNGVPFSASSIVTNLSSAVGVLNMNQTTGYAVECSGDNFFTTRPNGSTQVCRVVDTTKFGYTIINGTLNVKSGSLVVNGTSSATLYVDASGSSSYGGTLQLMRNGSSGTSLYDFNGASGFNIDTPKNITFNSAFSPVFFINTAGNVGIGTTNPSDRLSVVGSVGISDDLVVKGGSLVVNGTSSTTLYVDASGSSSYGGTLQLMRNGSSGTSLYDFNGASGFNIDTPKNFTINSAFSPVFHINTAGNVGIGKVTPTYKLSVVSADFINTELTRGSYSGYLGVGGSGGLFIGGNTSSASMTAFMPDGKVGVGTATPTAKIHLATNGAGDGTFLTNGILIQNTNATVGGETAISFYDSTLTNPNYWIYGINQGTGLRLAYGTGFSDANTKMSWDTNGRIGIGTASPQQVLDVRMGDTNDGLVISGTDGQRKQLIISNGTTQIWRTGITSTTGQDYGFFDGTQNMLILGRNGNVTIGKSGGVVSTNSYLQTLNFTYSSCTSALEGSIIYNSTAKKHYGCNSTNWNALY